MVLQSMNRRTGGGGRGSSDRFAQSDAVRSVVVQLSGADWPDAVLLSEWVWPVAVLLSEWD